MHYYRTSLNEIYKTYTTSADGLTEDQARQHLSLYGRNEIVVKGQPWWRKLLAPLMNLFMLVLALAAIVSFITHEVLDSAIIVVIMVVTAIIGYLQEASSERIFKALRNIDLQQVSVQRSGDIITIASNLLVPGDIIHLREGQKIPADARVIEASSVRVDESLLTGESKPVAKQPQEITTEVPVYEQTNMLFSGSFMVAGECTAVVVATGNKTEFGRLAELTQSDAIVSPVQKKIDRLIGQITIGVSIISVVVFALSLYRGIELTEAIRFVLALAVSAIPESLPVAISVVLVLGARQLAKKKALIRNLAAIENIGIITTIATDKTGTLTKNQLKVQDHWVPESSPFKTSFKQIVHLSTNQSDTTIHDPLDNAMADFSHSESIDTFTHTHSYPFNQQLAMSGNSWQIDTHHILSLKGSPESILSRCELTAATKSQIEDQILRLTSQGYRVIAIAQATASDKFAAKLDEAISTKLEFVGLLAVADELRPEAKSAIATTLSAGVTVRMITGDHFETAYAIGRELGLTSSKDEVFDCRQMTDLSDEELVKVVAKTKVFSRVLPEYKHRILEILKQQHITAMTGDGVNDVPALSNAHIGIAMGSGAQVAKEAGDIVLLDNNFASVVAALKQGRIVFDNIQRMVYYLLSTNAGEVLTMVGALALGIPLPLVPVQILWINIVTDTTLEIPLGLQPAEHQVLQRPPRNPHKPILGRAIIVRMLLIAVFMAAISLVTFMYFWQSYSTAYARTAAFNVLVVMQWANAFNARREWQSSIFTRSIFSSPLFYGAICLSILIHLATLYTPLSNVLHLVAVDQWHLIVPGAIGVGIIILVGELHKFYGRKWLGK